MVSFLVCLRAIYNCFTADHGDDAVFCIERLLDRDNPLLQTVANVFDYIRQALKIRILPICSPRMLPPMAEIGSLLSSRVTDRASCVWRSERGDDGHRPLWVRRLRSHTVTRPLLLRQLITQTRAAQASVVTYVIAGHVPNGHRRGEYLDRSGLRLELGSWVSVPKTGGKLCSCVVAMTGEGYGSEGAPRLFEALRKGIDASIYDAIRPSLECVLASDFVIFILTPTKHLQADHINHFPSRGLLIPFTVHLGNLLYFSYLASPDMRYTRQCQNIMLLLGTSFRSHLPKLDQQDCLGL